MINSREQPVVCVSFLDEKATLDLMFQLCDMNGDGKLDSEDLALFVPFRFSSADLAGEPARRACPHRGYRLRAERALRVAAPGS